MRPPRPLPILDAPYAADDATLAAELLTGTARSTGHEARIDRTATRLIEAIRADSSTFGGVEDLLREYALSTDEGLALMVLAEALLRVPDAATAERLIEDKLRAGDFAHHRVRSDTLLVSASAWALGLSSRLIRPGQTPEGALATAARRIGLPTLRRATRAAMGVLGDHFVLGQTIEDAIGRSRSEQRYRHSFDMLGEGARTAEDAARYLDSYADAIEAIGASGSNLPASDRPGISVKLSALHPRYEAVSHQRVMAELVPRLTALARRAREQDLHFTIDAEEADRLELSLDVIGAALADPSLAGWDGFGLAVQAYQKRALAVIRWVDALAATLDRRLTVRLVKGAYWDTEVKRAQERGLDDYPVFTRKSLTDLNFLACAEALLALRPRIFPQFATHNALTVASILAMAGKPSGFEFQRLHGMGEALYARLLDDNPDVACRIYAPVGRHRDLLAYLVRRLLENGANTSFVSAASDDAVPIETLLRRPAAILRDGDGARHPRLPSPRDLYAPDRRNSRGIEFGDRAALEGLLAEIDGARGPAGASPLIDGETGTGVSRMILSPIDAATAVGRVIEADPAVPDRAMQAARAGFPDWSDTPVEDRAAALDRSADLIEARRGGLIHLLQCEAGKTLDDAVAEIREASDFCRYYAAEARKHFGEGDLLPGPTGETNRLRLRGRGPLVAISPWNFPLAIFTGQVAAALVAGNTVVAKPAEQTPLIAAECIRLMHEAGIPVTALHLVTGDGAVGAALVEHPAVAGVIFTGSAEVARAINRALAAKDGPIVPLIAETGGINAMIVDATALPEQVTDDVIASAFRSAGQRCSALRLLCLQEDVADGVLRMIEGAARALAIGDPRLPGTHIGPVIDAEAKRRLDAHVAGMRSTARVEILGTAPAGGFYVAPHLIEIDRVGDLDREVFGPILHVVRYPAEGLDDLLDAIDANGSGLTLGIHSRIGATVAGIASRLRTGNVYVNRNMIGAVVGTQPFGGVGLSGTGPKAGGPHYLARLATEQTVTVNTAAAGGNADLATLDEGSGSDDPLTEC